MGKTTNEIREMDDREDSSAERVSHTSAPRTEDKADEGGREAAQIRSGIEQTRADLSETIDALQEKLDPARIAEQVKDQVREKATEAYDAAKNTVREATIGRAEKIVANVSETVSDVTERAGTAARDAGSSAVQYIRDNPVPFALVGIGVGMLAWNARRKQHSPYASGRGAYENFRTGEASATEASIADRAREVATGMADSARETARRVADTARAAADRATTAVSSATSSVRDAASTAAETTRQQLSQASDQARQSAQLATDRFKTTLQENPMALGVAALAAGAIVGLSLPSTRIEGEYMGEARDRLVNQAKSVTQEAAEKVQRVTKQAGRTLKDAAEKEGLTAAETNSSPGA